MWDRGLMEGLTGRFRGRGGGRGEGRWRLGRGLRWRGVERGLLGLRLGARFEFGI